MKKTSWIAILCTIILVGMAVSVNTDKKEIAYVKPSYEYSRTLISNNEDWDLFICALAWVESSWNPQAIGAGDDIGWLQCTPLMVEEANRILDEDFFSLDDRYSQEMSIEIFNVVMDERNPERDKHFALKIWNPKAPISYHIKVMDKYYELLKEYYNENHSEN